jgi:serine/threonine-protein kinase
MGGVFGASALTPIPEDDLAATLPVKTLAVQAATDPAVVDARPVGGPGSAQRGASPARRTRGAIILAIATLGVVAAGTWFAVHRAADADPSASEPNAAAASERTQPPGREAERSPAPAADTADAPMQAETAAPTPAPPADATATATPREPAQPAPPLPVAAAAPAPAAARVAPRSGKIDVRVKPWAEVYLGGRMLGVTPMPPVELPAGPQTLTLVNPKLGARKSVHVRVPEGGVTLVRFELP